MDLCKTSELKTGGEPIVEMMPTEGWGPQKWNKDKKAWDPAIPIFPTHLVLRRRGRHGGHRGYRHGPLRLRFLTEQRVRNIFLHKSIVNHCYKKNEDFRLLVSYWPLARFP